MRKFSWSDLQVADQMAYLFWHLMVVGFVVVGTILLLNRIDHLLDNVLGVGLLVLGLGMILVLAYGILHFLDMEFQSRVDKYDSY